MTTFTKLPDGEQALLEVDAGKRLSKIDPMIYGGFTEHMGRCIYGGMYDPGNPLSDEHGFRTDVLDALRELDIPVVRYPGGNFVATYHWLDGVGPRDKRPKRPELAWLGTETNQFGTDEFMQWLSVLSEGKKDRVEPYICLNMGTGTLDEALAWVEYCNGTKDTYYANLRRQNGHEEPYRVKYWALGNEIWGPWQVEQMTKEDYAKKAAQWAKALRLLDPSLCLILCGETGHSSWDHHVLKECVSVVDMHSIHIYTASAQHLPNVTAPLSAERAIQTAAALIDIARIENNVPPTKAQTTICFDEWNVWDPERAPGDKGAEEKYTLSDALAVAVWLNVFVRQSRYIGMANIAQTVNVISPLMTSKDGIVKQTTWWPLLLFSRFMRGWTVAAHVSCGSWAGETSPAWLQGVLQDGAPWLDVSAVVDDEGFVNVAVVNISDEADLEASLKGVSGKVEVHTVNGPGVKAVNVAGSDEVGVRESQWDGEGAFVFPKHSMTLLRWKAA
ncbi:family 51 glycoside hydrolase [Cryphonectria parasitica EP155]|uniref:non-reducing end alpha-L-arabinofuranosidase n=1 Tax=Cryphonectria parasitica (strain ATCC 38755 / EP155) TaxID=660469 RepID=A0A9P4Y2Q4_CRYP1|nr:family 51 glycoside hydrolase [Cryphonectria parasitica EP155]KAF3765892.1 family 51 glycoside hydrolase [Cryphonectria parasitica EP155]